MMIPIFPDWPAPASVRAFTTTRIGGHSFAAYESFNVADHVGDQAEFVSRNRALLAQHLPNTPYWLRQTHSTCIVEASATPQAIPPEADAAWTSQSRVVCVVLTADCLPVLFCDHQGTLVAAVHAGWRGLLHGMLEKTVETLNVAPHHLLVWIGPAISQAAYAVNEAFRADFISADANAVSAFSQSSSGQWHADLYAIAKQRLQTTGIPASAIYGGDFCTYHTPDRFYSARRDGLKTGRIASLIWLEKSL